MIRRHSLVLIAVLLLLCALSCSAKTVYVKWDSPGPTFDGTSWDTAFHTVQAGLNAATSGDEVWVAKGAYVERITLKKGVGLYGGFVGTETSRDQRNWNTNITILDGNQAGTVVSCPSSAVDSTIIDGFTIRNGKNTYGPGGISCSYSSPTIRNNTITNNNGTDGAAICCVYSYSVITNNLITGNISSSDGGAIYCEYYAPTITNNIITKNEASSGGAVFCTYSSPTIADNTLIGNVVTGGGGAVYIGPWSLMPAVITNNTIEENSAATGGGIHCYGSSPTITNNRISDNGAGEGGGIYCDSTSSRPIISNNIIAGNRADLEDGGGIYSSASASITNNTIVANRARLQGGGVFCLYSLSQTVCNNIVAFNSSGLFIREENSATVRNNCVYSNTKYNHFYPQVGAQDIFADPLLAAKGYGNFHIQPGSPCIDAGWNGVNSPTSTDMDGQPRTQGSTLDIGADESNGMTWPAGPYIIVRVSPTGNDANDGSSWALAKKTVQAGVDAARELGGEVWVKAGTYRENITVRMYAYLYGGFTGTETSRDERNWTANISILDAAGFRTVVMFVGGDHVSALDGFTIRNGKANSGGGIRCQCSSPVIANNDISQNQVSMTGGGIYCEHSSPTIVNNSIWGNTAFDGGGIGCFYYSSPVITGNTISQNSATFGSGGIRCENYSNAQITNNIIYWNNGPTGSAIRCQYSSPTITNNTICGNTSTGTTGSVYIENSSPTVSNNIIALNSSGIFSGGTGTPVLRNNCVYRTSGYSYSGIPAGEGDISLYPLFVDSDNGNYHLSASSPCINAGWNDAPDLPAIDMEGQGRIFGRKADIGADEYWSPAMSVPDARYAANGVKISGQDAVVSAAFDGFFYIEASDRSSGIRVEKASHGVQTGDKVNITGTLKTNTNGERFIEASSVEVTGTGSVAPVHIISRALGGGNWFYNPTTGAGQCGVVGGSGLNNIGLLVRTWGKISYLDGAYALDLGSDKTAKILAEGMSIGGKETYVQITGISSCYRDASGLHPTLLVTDVTPVQ